MTNFTPPCPNCERSPCKCVLDSANTPEWHLTKEQAGELVSVILEFQEKLPGWWWSVGNCNYSADASCYVHQSRASCAPTQDSPNIERAAKGNPFDHGFHCDLAHPASMADSLRDVMRQAIEAKKRGIQKAI